MQILEFGKNGWIFVRIRRYSMKGWTKTNWFSLEIETEKVYSSHNNLIACHSKRGWPKAISSKYFVCVCVPEYDKRLYGKSHAKRMIREWSEYYVYSLRSSALNTHFHGYKHTSGHSAGKISYAVHHILPRMAHCPTDIVRYMGMNSVRNFAHTQWDRSPIYIIKILTWSDALFRMIKVENKDKMKIWI